MQARRIARELALLSISQLPNNPERLNAQKLQDLVVAAVRTLATEARDALETAAAELQRGNNQLLTSETRSHSIESSKAMVKGAIDLTEAAINRLGNAIEIPEFIQLANQPEVRGYTLEIMTRIQEERKAINEFLSDILVDWNLDRLASIDRDILRIAIAEMMYLGTPDRVAINEAVELSKKYSGEDGHRFINGVLRRATEQLQRGAKTQS